MLRLYTCTDDKRKLEKTLTQTLNIPTINIKDSTNIINPVISLSRTSSAQSIVGFATLVLSSNYCYFSDFERYYFIKNIEVTPGITLILHLEVDPLMSFASQIKTLPVIAKRWNKERTFIDDNNLPMFPVKTVKVIEFSGGDFNIETATANSQNFVLTVAGGGNSNAS